MFRPDFSKKGVCSKSVTKNALLEQGFGKWIDFQISLPLKELLVIRDWLCVRDITETSLNRFVTVAYLKKQPP